MPWIALSRLRKTGTWFARIYSGLGLLTGMQGMQMVSPLIELHYPWTEPYETQNNIFSRNININNLLNVLAEEGGRRGHYQRNYKADNVPGIGLVGQQRKKRGQKKTPSRRFSPHLAQFSLKAYSQNLVATTESQIMPFVDVVCYSHYKSSCWCIINCKEKTTTNHSWAVLPVRWAAL